MYDTEKLAIRPASEYTSAPFNIDLRTNTAVTQLKLDENKVVLENGEELEYNQLVVATGASPRSLPVDGNDLEGVLKIRGVEHAKQCSEGMFCSFSSTNLISSA
jgi:NAD(P)H-nitrite reductase large subunit